MSGNMEEHRAIICNVEPPNQALIKHLHILIENPHFFHEERKIYIVWDPPNLMKSIRNIFYKSRLTFYNEKYRFMQSMSDNIEEHRSIICNKQDSKIRSYTNRYF